MKEIIIGILFFVIKSLFLVIGLGSIINQQWWMAILFVSLYELLDAVLQGSLLNDKTIITDKKGK